MSDAFEKVDELIKKAVAGEPRFEPINYAQAYGQLSGMIQWLATRAKFANPSQGIDLKADILRVALEEKELRERIDAQTAANMEALKP